MLLFAVLHPLAEKEREQRRQVTLEWIREQEAAERAYEAEVAAEKARWEDLEAEETFTYFCDEGVTDTTEEIEDQRAESLIQSRDWDADDAYLLARIAMAEAEGEDTEAKALVVCVVLNRVWSDSFPDTIEEVIFEKNQFSPIDNGRWDRVEPNEDCYKAVEMVANGWDKSQGATYFELTRDYSTWHSRNLDKLFEYGDTTFYKEVVKLEAEK